METERKVEISIFNYEGTQLCIRFNNWGSSLGVESKVWLSMDKARELVKLISAELPTDGKLGD